MELLVVLGVLTILAAVVLPALYAPTSKAPRIACANRLKNLGLAFRIFATDHTNMFPMSLSTKFGGSHEFVGSRGVYRHFAAISYELATPLLLRCPSDATRRAAKDFGPEFSDANVSYFVGLDADESRPQMLLSGDRNITNGSIANPPWILELRTNAPAGWTKALHRYAGNVALADGSVQAFDSLRLQQHLAITGDQTNRIQLPEAP